MASTIVEFRAPTGMTLDLDLYPYGSDTIANGASGDAATEATNRKGLYTATVTEALTGWHTAHIMSGTTVIAVYDVDLLDDTSTYRCHDRDQVQTGDSFARIGAPAGASIAADVAAILSTAMTEAYAATGGTVTAAQALYEILQNLTESANASSTRTVKKRDQSTTAKTYTYDDGTSPTSITTD